MGEPGVGRVSRLSASVPPPDHALAEARQLLESAERTLVLTGAGVSAESGVPTFRGPNGLWKNRRPEELATPQAFRADPRLVWEWYGWRRQRLSACRPNAAHRALARLTLRNTRSRIVTQNVDGLHEQALEEASAADDAARPPKGAFPLALHGSVFGARCVACRLKVPHRDPIDASDEASLPRCSDCRGLLRPDVVWFGEALDPRVLEDAFETAESAQVCLVVGTSAVVQPAASIPLLTHRAGGVVVEVNPEPTPLSPIARFCFRARAAGFVPRLLAL